MYATTFGYKNQVIRKRKAGSPIVMANYQPTMLEKFSLACTNTLLLYALTNPIFAPITSPPQKNK